MPKNKAWKEKIIKTKVKKCWGETLKRPEQDAYKPTKQKEKYKTYRKELRDLPAKYEALMRGNYEYKDKILTKNGVEHNYFPSI